MIITLQPGIPLQQREQVQGFVSQLGFSTTAVSTQSGEYLVAIGSREVDLRQVHQCPGVKDVHRVTDVYKLVSRTWKVKPTQVDLGDGVCIG